jgi:hypothetical protein
MYDVSVKPKGHTTGEKKSLQTRPHYDKTSSDMAKVPLWQAFNEF